MGSSKKAYKGIGHKAIGLLNSPFAHYAIATSHNTFVGAVQLLTFSKASLLRKALDRGYRALELDIHNLGDYIFISHADGLCFCSTPLPVVKAIETIVGFIKENPNCSPIIIFIQNDLSGENKNDLEGVFGTMLHSAADGYLVHGLIDPWTATPEQYRGKILITDKTWSNNSIYATMINFRMDDSHSYLKKEEAPKLDYISQRQLVKAYPSNIYLSRNMDFSVDVAAKAQFVSVNPFYSDKWLKIYEERFKNSNEGYLFQAF